MGLAIADTKELLEDTEMEMLHSLLETISFWENLKEGDTRRLKRSLLFKVTNMTRFVRYLIPNLTCFSTEKIMRIWPFREKEKKNMCCSLFFCKKRNGSKMCDKNVNNSNNDVENDFGNKGDDIVTGALKIFNKKNETDKICQKEEEESQWKDTVNGALKILIKKNETEWPKKEYESGFFLEVGPIWDYKHAHKKAKEHCSQTEFHWTGHWNTTIANKMSVIGVKRRRA